MAALYDCRNEGSYGVFAVVERGRIRDCTRRRGDARQGQGVIVD
jgi:hypothetical protein